MKNTPQIAETITETGRQFEPALCIAVPTYKHNPSALVKALAACDRAEDAQLVIYDDGSGDADLTSRLADLLELWPGKAKLITAAKNAGRAYARNRMAEHSETDWVLLLDADMLPDSSDFLTAYLDIIQSTAKAAIVAGGFSLDQVTPNPSQELHAAQSHASECLSAAERAEHPGRYVFTSNILVHRKILETVAFDNGFAGWGWEDTDWGLRVAKAYPVLHIENTATHTGLDDTESLLEKYGTSGANFARMVNRNPEDAQSMTLTKAARKLAKLPGRSLIRRVSKAIASSTLPAPLRLKALKMYRAAAYAEHLR